MAGLRSLSIALSLVCCLPAAADSFDGTAPLECLAEQTFDCLPGMKACGPVKRETSIEPVFGVDFAKREVHSPFRMDVMRAAHTTTNRESLILQGTELAFAWSALINKTTGVMSIAVLDRKGGYMAFGHCKVKQKKSTGATDSPTALAGRPDRPRP